MQTSLGLARKSNGNIVVASITGSGNFPTLSGRLGPSCRFGDAFVSILDPSGSTLMASTLLGGTDQDFALDVRRATAGGDGHEDHVLFRGISAGIGRPSTSSAAFRGAARVE